ncbi:YfgM family protein [Halomonas nitroreducens]|uniref:Ancillary SecYEG translocon subunit n=1 Tax=Halomonas nitroreducens TaxID=447425 RepID=A0A3S0HRP3_9GAMM|nr:tetratricopeptide repeat protein [Halomonas nitroreducens]RTR01998.1 tetratricopeptide repeat protein [Halomonas nitroreducens]
MAELRTEEEQLEAIKRWWKENGTSLVVGAVIAAAGVFGWKAWQDYQTGQAEAASQRYQQLLTLSGQDALDEAARQQADDLVTTLTEDHGDSLYADLARLLDARLAVQAGDTAAARTALEGLIDESPRPYLQGLARLRLARLQLAADDAEAALASLDGEIPAPLAAQRADIRGDAHLALGDREAARDAWREALSLSEASDQPLYGVQLKLDDLGVEETTS